MLKTLEIYYNTILQTFTKDTNESPICLISGGIGTGKSYLFDAITNAIVVSDSVDAVIKLDQVQNARFITDLFHDKRINVKQTENQDYKLIVLSELEYNYEHFNNEISILKSFGENDFLYYDLAYKLKSSYYWAENYSAIREAETIASNSVKSNFSKKSIHRLLLDSFTVSVESFIVDLMNIFYTLNDSENLFIKNDIKKKVIVFAMDDLDAINGSMYMFLVSYLLPYFFNKTFGEFTSYHISFIDESLKVADLFDFRIIFTSRNSFDSIIANIPEYLHNKLQHYKLSNLSVVDYEEIESEIHFPSLVSNAAHFEITQGIPSLVLDKQASSLSGEYDFTSAIVYKGFNELTKYFNEKDKQILYVLSFMDSSLNSFFIKYLKEPQIEFYEIENFLLYNSFLLDDNSANSLKPEIRYLVKNYLKFHARTVFDSLQLLHNSIIKINDYLVQFTDPEFEIIETLAFLPKENNLELARIAFPDNIDDLEMLYKRNRLIFNSAKYIMNPDIAKLIKEFVKLINPTKFAKLSELHTYLHSKIDEEKERIQVQQTAEMKSLEKEYKAIDSIINSKKNEFKEYQSKLMFTENLMIELRRQINNSSFSVNLLVSSIIVVFTIAMAMIAYFLPNIVQPSSDNSPVYSIQFILYSIFVVLFICSITFSNKTYKIYKQNEQNIKLEENLNNLEKDKSNHLKNMQICKDFIDSKEIRKKELYALLQK